ncbi:MULTISPECIES: helix-turn-helix domain-containing protein [unclassified Lactococcus]|uniref:helix-turn-helix domain-containing protein n=1 Tax=unclassified Lactococcus TaxID=2643510 RepID=UPI00164F0DC4|nr:MULTISPECIES: helix-turn-helix transcriptional regulator [unclassified Lactococcus]
MELSDRLKQIRTERGLTQKQIADIIGIYLQSYRKYELGERTPGKKSLENISKALNVPVGYLVGEVENNDEVLLIELFRNLSDSEKVKLLNKLKNNTL